MSAQLKVSPNRIGANTVEDVYESPDLPHPSHLGNESFALMRPFGTQGNIPESCD